MIRLDDHEEAEDQAGLGCHQYPVVSCSPCTVEITLDIGGPRLGGLFLSRFKIYFQVVAISTTRPSLLVALGCDNYHW